MGLKSIITTFLLLVCLPFIVLSQNNSAEHSISCEIPEVALLSLASGNEENVGITAIAPVTAGNSISGFNINQSAIWVNYSSVVDNKNHKRKIVAMLDGNVPDYLKVYVTASDPMGTGKGTLGKSSGITALSNNPTEVINDIGSCYTGTGINNGHFLTYSIEFDKTSDEYSELAQSNTSFNVVYTLTDTY